ncbi:bacteriocin-associated integral membrane family protein [Streptomyces sp. NPDC058008]|uniref:bacteriocin-associated integral membrane family protein n=1 Tax=Streptomyces sp. NPDC058008 TaxID=3346303 RepID=UPI0036E6136B
MLHRGIKFVHAAILAFSVVLSFLFLRGLDESTVLGNSALVTVLDSDDSVSAAQAVRLVESFATEHGVAVGREVPDLKNPDGRRHLYLATGDAGTVTASWLSKGYPAFSEKYDTRVHPLSEIGHQDPRGSYYVFGSSEAADALVAGLSDRGMVASVIHPLSYEELSKTYTDDPLFRALGVVALAALTMTGASVLLNVKTYAVLRMQGMSFTGVLLHDLRQLRVSWLIAAGVVATTTLGFLGLYNGFAWLGLFTLVTVVIAVLLSALVLATHAAVLALTYKVDVLPALKGELPSRAASISVYLVRIPALLLALSIAGHVSFAARDVLTRQENREVYDTVGDAVSIRLNGAFAMQLDELDKHVGPWLRQADQRGEVIVSGRRDLQLSVPEAHLPAGEILIVNDTYLGEQPVVGINGRRYSATSGNGNSKSSQVRVIVPESLTSHTPDITQAASRIIDPHLSRNIPLETLTSKTGQRVFGYNTGTNVYSAAHSADEDRSLVDDPVLIVVPNGSFLTNDAYATFATQGGVVFPDPNDALNGIRSQSLRNYVSSVSPVGQKAALDLREASNKFRLHTFNLIIAMIVLLVAGAGVCIIYSRKNAQNIFVRHISGWRYSATHRFILAVEVAIAIIFASRVPFENWQQNRELRDLAAAGAPAPFEAVHITALDTSVITGLVVFELAAVLLALAFFHRRIIKEGATEG